MVKDGISDIMEQSDHYILPNPIDEYNRAKSDYLFLSQTFDSYSSRGYLEAEEKAWQRYVNARNKVIEQNPPIEA